MSDDPHDSPPPDAPASNPNGGSATKAAARAGTGVRSGLAERRNPALVALGDFSAGARRLIFKDLLNTFLLCAAIGLALAFALLLRSIGPSTVGAQIPISQVESLAAHRDISSAVLLDHDNRVDLTTVAREGTVAREAEPSRRLWSSYPSSGAQTAALISASVTVNEQSGKSLRAIIVQFLIPILLLVCLFALFTRIGADGGAGGIAGFSAVHRKGQAQGQGHIATAITFADVAGAGEAVAELREIRDYLADPRQVPEGRGGRSQGRAAGGAARHGQDAAGQGGRGRGRRLVLLAVGLGLRGVAGRRRRGARARPVRARPARRAGDHLHRRARRRRAQARRRHRSGQRRARADAQPLLVEMDGFPATAGSS
jgi:cell division protease FtsH